MRMTDMPAGNFSFGSARLSAGDLDLLCHSPYRALSFASPSDSATLVRSYGLAAHTGSLLLVAAKNRRGLICESPSASSKTRSPVRVFKQPIGNRLFGLPELPYF
jgi:hypothetical protein